MMNVAEFFQKNSKKRWCNLLFTVYQKIFLRSNKARVQYSRKAGAKIGKGTVIPRLSMLGTEPFLVEIGENTRFTGNATRILTHDGAVPRLKYMGVLEQFYDYMGKIKIGSNCFFGNDIIILKHVTIGDNCIVGAGSVVTKSIPANSVAAGVPAKVICTVEEYAERIKDRLDDTVGLTTYEKRKYVETHMDKYEEWRLEREVR
jgi:acetyltransferase-like isoleucine patch superfamily enzyme